MDKVVRCPVCNGEARIVEPEHRYFSYLDGQPLDQSELGHGRGGIYGVENDRLVLADGCPGWTIYSDGRLPIHTED
jgi:hypothetical protein